MTLLDVMNAVPEEKYGYRVLLCADSVIPPSPWTDDFDVEVDDDHRVIRLSGEFI